MNVDATTFSAILGVAFSVVAFSAGYGRGVGSIKERMRALEKALESGESNVRAVPIAQREIEHLARAVDDLRAMVQKEIDHLRERHHLAVNRMQEMDLRIGQVEYAVSAAVHGDITPRPRST